MPGRHTGGRAEASTDAAAHHVLYAMKAHRWKGGGLALMKLQSTSSCHASMPVEKQKASTDAAARLVLYAMKAHRWKS